ncbi:MAG TPA: stage II sporulation protein M, partial [Blastocatellia bacterium]|nr:stage II sporulation protein M [Blastocatellia bacterium]
ALVLKGRLAVTLMLGCATMLVFAGLIEGFISPAPISYVWKLTVSGISAILMTVYFLKPDRRPDSGDGSRLDNHSV